MKLFSLTSFFLNVFRIKRQLVFCISILFFTDSINGQTFSDNATNSAYSGGWNNGTNGGSGFQAWGLASDGGNAGHFRADPTGNGMSNAGIGTTAFGMYGHSSQYAYALRNFNSTMAVGDIFSFYWAMNFDCGSTGGKGWELRSGTTNVFGVNNGSSAEITYNGVSTGTVSSNYGTTPMLVTIQRTSCDQYTISITRRNISDGTFSVTISSSLAIDNIRIYIGAQQDGVGGRNMYFNAFQIQKPTRYQSRASGNWGDAAVWQISTDGGTSWSNAVTAPSGTYDIFTILNGHSITLNSAATASSLTINSGGTFNNGTGQTITFPCNGTITNNGTFNRNTGTITFSSTGTVSGAVLFHNLNTSGGLTLGAGANQSTIYGTFTLNNGGFIASAPPKYATGSTLAYNTGGTFNRSDEWPTGINVETVPHHVTVRAGTTLNLDVKTGPTGDNSHYDTEGRTMYGDLDLYGTLTMGSNSGTMAEDLVVGGNVTIRNTGGLILGSQKPSDVKIADIQLGLNWVVEQGGFFDASRRAVIFNGTTTTEQTFTSGNAIENFGYLIVNKPAISGVEGTVKMFCDSYIYGQNQGSIIQLLNGSLDLNGRSMTLNVRDTINNVDQNISIDGTDGNLTRRIFNSSATAALFNITHFRSTSHVDTVKRNSAKLSLLTFGTNIIVTVGSTTGNVGINFGSGLTTINGTLRINARGFVDINPPTYNTNSLLQYNIGSTYNRNAEWNASSGPGYPYNVQTSLSGTRLIAGGASNTATALNMVGSLTVDASTSLDMTNAASNNMTVPLIVGLDINLNGTLIASGNAGGNVQLGRNWTRDITTGTFTDNTRRLIFNSSLPSIINLTAAGTEIFYEVGTEKTLSTNTITLNKPVTITKAVYFGTGTVVSSLTNLLIFNDETDALGESDNSFVDGPVAKIGNDLFDFPVGKPVASITPNVYNSTGLTGGYRPISISAPVSVTDVFTAEFFHRNANLIGPITSPGLQGVSACEYWGLKRESATNVSVTLSWMPKSVCNPTNYISNISAVVVAMSSNGTPLSHPSGQWNFHGGTATGNANSGTATWTAPLGSNYKLSASPGYEAYTPFTLGTTNWQQAPLPFDVKHFKAAQKNNQVQLDWSVNFNQQVKSYVIERSRDGIQFEILKQVAARSNEVNASYTDLDAAPYNGWGYYRLRITDMSGQITYTSTQKVWTGKKGTFIQVTPNPAVNEVWISIAQPEKITEINLMNGLGQVLYKTNKLNSLNRIDVSSFAPGIYYLRMTGKDGVFVETVVKK